MLRAPCSAGLQSLPFGALVPHTAGADLLYASLPRKYSSPATRPDAGVVAVAFSARSGGNRPLRPVAASRLWCITWVLCCRGRGRDKFFGARHLASLFAERASAYHRVSFAQPSPDGNPLLVWTIVLGHARSASSCYNNAVARLRARRRRDRGLDGPRRRRLPDLRTPFPNLATALLGRHARLRACPSTRSSSPRSPPASSKPADLDADGAVRQPSTPVTKPSPSSSSPSRPAILAAYYLTREPVGAGGK